MFKMTCTASSTVVPTSTLFSEDRIIPLQDNFKTVAINTDRRSRTIAATGDGMLGYVPCTSPQLRDSRGEGDTLKWCEARRIGSEPVGLQSWPSTASLECGERDGEDDDDVFTERSFTYGDWSVYPEDEYENWLDFGWGEFTIPAQEISLTSIISHSCDETVFSGYWHGSVHVIAREARSSLDARWFCQEVTTLNKIRHESIQLFMGMTLDMGGGHLGLVMSPLKGESLHTRLHAHGHQFSMTSKFKIVKQISEGMEYLHSRGISHGRLSTTTVHILNRVCIQFRPQVRLPRYVSCHGLVSLPPEDVRALSLHHGSLVLPNPPSFKPDIFAFGTLLYELVLLGKPFKNVSRECVIWSIGSGRFQPLSLLPRDRLRGIIQRCWRLSPDSRPTFKSILTDVEQNVPVFSTQPGSSGLQRSLSLPSVLTDPPSPRLIY